MDTLEDVVGTHPMVEHSNIWDISDTVRQMILTFPNGFTVFLLSGLDGDMYEIWTETGKIKRLTKDSAFKVLKLMYSYPEKETMKRHPLKEYTKVGK